MARNFQVWREIITEDGKRGSYCCANGLLTVTTPNGSKTTQLGALWRRAAPHAKYRRPSFPNSVRSMITGYAMRRRNAKR